MRSGVGDVGDLEAVVLRARDGVILQRTVPVGDQHGQGGGGLAVDRRGTAGEAEHADRSVGEGSAGLRGGSDVEAIDQVQHATGLADGRRGGQAVGERTAGGDVGTGADGPAGEGLGRDGSGDIVHVAALDARRGGATGGLLGLGDHGLADLTGRPDDRQGGGVAACTGDGRPLAGHRVSRCAGSQDGGGLLGEPVLAEQQQGDVVGGTERRGGQGRLPAPLGVGVLTDGQEELPGAGHPVGDGGCRAEPVGALDALDGQAGRRQLVQHRR